jgi:beta-barrel assembly-enhancing protease
MRLNLRWTNAGILILLVVLSGSCSKNDKSINIFSVEDDISLGARFDQEIMAKPAEYPVLDSVQFKNAYAHLYRIRNTVLASGKLNYTTRFPWKCKIIRNDTIINAFCVPGGYMYFYTGIIKLLDNEAQFAGVMAHEMVHADRRHTTDLLTIQYGIDILLGLVLGNNPDQLATIVTDLALGLGNLAYSRQNEYEADKYAVIYLYPTEYNASSLGDFFVKMSSQPRPPAFLSTHPSPEDRLQKITEEFNALGGHAGGLFPERYLEFKQSIP